MNRRNVLNLGIVVSGVAVSALLVAGCETYHSEHRAQVWHGPPVANEGVILVVPEGNHPGYGNERRYDRERREN